MCSMRITFFVFLLIVSLMPCSFLKAERDNLPGDSITSSKKNFISPNLRILGIEDINKGMFKFGVSGFGLSLGRITYKNKISFSTGLGLDYFKNVCYHHYFKLQNYFYVIHSALYFSEKICFSKIERKIKPCVFTDIGWTFILNEKELDETYSGYYTQYSGSTAIDTKGGLYLKPGFALDYSINPSNSLSLDMSFEMCFTQIFARYSQSFISRDEEFHMIFRLLYSYKF